jgi:magnesium chelatase subunit I
LFNILEERDVQIRGYPVSFDIDVMVLFSANPQTYNRSGKVIPQLKDRIGATIQTHYPQIARGRDRDHRAGGPQGRARSGRCERSRRYPVIVPRS